jgi:hypothetical protein
MAIASASKLPVTLDNPRWWRLLIRLLLRNPDTRPIAAAAPQPPHRMHATAEGAASSWGMTRASDRSRCEAWAAERATVESEPPPEPKRRRRSRGRRRSQRRAAERQPGVAPASGGTRRSVDPARGKTRDLAARRSAVARRDRACPRDQSGVRGAAVVLRGARSGVPLSSHASPSRMSSRVRSWLAPVGTTAVLSPHSLA